MSRNYRRHLRDKRFIENRSPVKPELVEWARNYKNEIAKRREEKEKSLAAQDFRSVLSHCSLYKH